MVDFKSFFAQEYFRNPLVLWILILSLTANLADWLILKIWIRPIDAAIILHYNVYFGVDVTGAWQKVFWAPAVGLILFGINLLLSIYFYNQKERIASYLLLLAILMIQLSLIVASASVILINY